MLLTLIFCLLLLVDILNFIIKGDLKRTLKSKSKSYLIKGLVNNIMLMMFVVAIGYYFNLEKKNVIYLLIMSGISLMLIINFNIQLAIHSLYFDNLSQFMLRCCLFFRIHKKSIPAISNALEGLDTSFSLKVNPYLKELEEGASIMILKKLSNHYLLSSMVGVFDAAEHIGMHALDHQLKRLEHDIELWIAQTKAHQNEERTYRTRLNALLLISVGIAYLAQRMLISAINIAYSPTYQTLILGFLSGLLLGLVIMHKRNLKSWFLKEELI